MMLDKSAIFTVIPAKDNRHVAIEQIVMLIEILPCFRDYIIDWLS